MLPATARLRESLTDAPLYGVDEGAVKRWEARWEARFLVPAAAGPSGSQGSARPLGPRSQRPLRGPWIHASFASASLSNPGNAGAS